MQGRGARASALRRIAAGVAVLLTLPLAACTGTPGPGPGSATASASPTDSGPSAVFTFGTASQPLGLDPAVVSDIESYRITRQVLEGLVGVDQTTGQPTPLLATEWTTSEDGRAYTFKLREKVTFQDGTAFDAAAVCSNFDRWFNFSNALRQQAPGTTFKGVFKAHADQASLSIYKGCTAVAPDNVTIELTQPFTGFLQALTLPAFAISSPQALASRNADELNQSRDGQPVSAYGLHPVGTGPYVFSSWDPGSITLASNKDYWGDKGQIGTINFVTYDHTQTRMQALLDGKIDAYDAVTVGNFDQLVKRGQQIVQRDPFSVMYLGMNQEVPILQNVKVRQAIEMALDKDTLIRKFFIDNTAQATQFVPPKLSGFNNNAPALGHNPAKAKELLTEAGYQGEELKFYYPLNVTRPYLPTPGKGIRGNQQATDRRRAEHQAGARRVVRGLPPEGHLPRRPRPPSAGLERFLRRPGQLRGPALRREHRRVRLPGPAGLFQDRPRARPAGRQGADGGIPDHQLSDRRHGPRRADRFPDLRACPVRPRAEVSGVARPE